MSTAVGIDGCKGGWFFFRRDQGDISHGVADSLQSLIKTLPTQSRVFIDIPIGLIDRGNIGRACDTEARQLLGSTRASSVFSAPCRPVLSALNYPEAKERSFSAIGKMLSKQAYAITPKIKDVDDYLVENNKRNIVVREVHPEICFWGLNNREPMKNRKKDKAGFEERLDVLSRFIPESKTTVDEALNSYLRKEVARDDILDALVALVMASTSDDALETVPKYPSKDSYGLPMEMVFTEHPNDRAL